MGKPFESSDTSQVGNACVGQSSCAVSVGDGTLNGQAENGEVMAWVGALDWLISRYIKIMMYISEVRAPQIYLVLLGGSDFV